MAELKSLFNVNNDDICTFAGDHDGHGRRDGARRPCDECIGSGKRYLQRIRYGPGSSWFTFP